MMSTIEHTAARVRAFIASRQMKQSDMADRSGVTARTIQNLMQPGWRANIDTLMKIERIIPPDFVLEDTQDTAA